MEKIKIAILGMGSRGNDTYAQGLLKLKDRAELVAIAESREDRRLSAMREYGLREEMCFKSGEELLAAPKLADAVFICTQDRQHVDMAIPAMRKGYDVLMEKPISPDAEQLRRIVRVQRETGRRVVVCHVLRYTPFFGKLKEIIDSGRIGRVIAIQALENVRHWHQAHSFVRGNWRDSRTTSPMIMQKCCHDLDYLVWLTGDCCERVSSFGDLTFFREENAPEGSAERCTQCAYQDTCAYSAVRIYLTDPETGILAGNNDWPCNVLALDPDEEKIRRAIEEGPYGRCAFRCDNNVVDHQVVNMQMEHGATLTLTMCAFTSVGGRTLHILGTQGDIRADMHENVIRVGEFGKEPEVIDVRTLAEDFSGHAGGDIRMLEQFIGMLEGEEPDSTVTTLEASVESHLIALAAEESRLDNGRCVALADMRG